MSRSVDNRVVGLKFDNAQFKSGAGETLGILDKLKAALRMDGLKGGMGRLADGVPQLNRGLAEAGTGVDGISKKFLALSTVGITALSNITNRAVNAGLSFAKSFTLDPLKAGFNEYELKMGSIQTILSNTARYGTKLPAVTKALDELNHYADKTIYNFGDMTRNVGLFTNAGLRVEEATSIIKGFSNEAAASGTSAEGAASAAYQLSQALSAGTVRLMDFKSLQNVGMGNQNMKDGLVEIADSMGTLDKAGLKAEDTQKHFNESLEKGWLSSEVMSNYLKIMAGDMSVAEQKALGLSDAQIKLFSKQQKMAEDAATKVRTFTQLVGTIRESVGSSYSEIFGLLIGDFNGATTLFTDINNTVGGMIGKFTDARVKLIKGFVKMGGRETVLDGLANIFKAVLKLITPITRAFRDVFPPQTVKGLLDMADGFKNFTAGLIISNDASRGLRSTFRGLFSILHIGYQIIGGILRYFLGWIPLIFRAGDGAASFTGSIGDLIYKLDQWLSKGNKIGAFFDHIIAGREKLLGPIIDKIGDLIAWLGKLASSGAIKFFDGLVVVAQFLDPYLDAILDKIKQLADSAKNGLGGVLDSLKGVGSSVLSGLSGGAGKLGSSLKSSLGGLSGSIGGQLTGVFDSGKVGKATGAVRTMKMELGGVGDKTKAIGDAWQRVQDFLGRVKDLAATALGKIGEALSGTGGKLKDSLDLDFQDILAIINTGFFIAFYRLASGFFKNLSGLSDAAKGFFKGGTASFGQLTSTLKTMQNEVRANIIQKIAVALVLLAGALYILSLIEPKKLASGLGALGAMMVILVIAMKSMMGLLQDKSLKDSAKFFILATALIAIGLAMNALALAVKIFATMSWEELAKGLSGFALTLGAVVGALVLMDKFGGDASLIKAAVSIGILAVAMTALAGAIKLYSAIDVGTLINGGLKLVAVILGIGLAMRAIPSTAIKQAAALVLVAGAMTALAVVLKIFASMSIGEMVKSLIMLGGSLAILVVALNAMSGTLTGSAALLVAAMAIGVLVPSLVILGSLSIGTIVKGLLALAGIFAVLGVAALILAPLAPVILTLAGAIALLGLGIGAVGLGMFLFATGLALLATTGAAGIAVIIAGLFAFAEALPLLIQQFGLALLAIAKVVINTAPAMAQAVTVLIGAFLVAATRLVPKFGRLLAVMILTGLAVMRSTVPQVAATAIYILLRLLNTLANNIGKITAVAVKLIVKFASALAQQSPKLATAGAKLIIKFINDIAKAVDKYAPQFRAACGRLGKALIDGMLGGIADGAGSIIKSVSGLAGKALGALKDKLHINSPSRATRAIMQSFGEGARMGIDDGVDSVAKSASNMGEAAITVLKTSMGKGNDILGDILDTAPAITPVLDLTQLANDASKISGMLPTPNLGTGSYELGASLVRTENGPDSGIGGNGGTHVEQTFNQTILSPKPADPIENYRRTNSQLGQAKEALISVLD